MICTQGFFRHNYFKIWGREEKEGRKERIEEEKERKNLWTLFTTGSIGTTASQYHTLPEQQQKIRSGSSAFLLVVACPLRVHSASTRARNSIQT